jgi:hypothetical protein
MEQNASNKSPSQEQNASVSNKQLFDVVPAFFFTKNAFRPVLFRDALWIFNNEL